uniref:NADH-ubiquinone oxidoreductase chain 4 n=1 Tax=Zele chlorophthalmus TaxID=1080924 RepID=A0A345X0Q0_ZELCH|nr:NADH dehydrogenase subunit 4 [Zele chlorophthalmus]AXK15292.1 NADH dehydrogenase subunit 4 [Zele chlorophthalmus]
MMKLMLMMFSFFFMNFVMKDMKVWMNNLMFMLIPLLLMSMNINIFYFTKIYYIYGLDNLSFNLILLTMWIMNLSFMSNFKFLLKKFSNMFITVILLMLMILMVCFLAMNMFMFYIFFEASLIPMMLMIMGWGAYIDRVQASMYMLLYTLFGSLPLLLMLMMLMNKYFSNSFVYFMFYNNDFINKNLFMFIGLFIGFLIKTPMYFTHLWLPKAHVEAPVSGSMILAGIMLKLGCYGIYRLILMFSDMVMNYSYFMVSLMLMGSIFSSIICLTQNDMKIIVAYSSIVHMNMMVASMFTLSFWGMNGGVMLMVSHGLCSSVMFFGVNLMYEYSNTRNILVNKGLINLSPSFTMWWFLICSSNFSAPPSLNLFGEILLINGLMTWLKLNMLPIFMIMLLSTYYSIFLFYSTQHGKIFNLYNIKSMNSWEYLIIFMHWFPLNCLFMNLWLF